MARRHNLKRPGGFRRLLWRLAYATPVTIPLDVDVALCFGDVCRVLQLLAADDAELDDDAHPAMRALLPVQHKRLTFVSGVLSADNDDNELRKPAMATFAGSTMDSNRQICEHNGLKKESTYHVAVPHQSIWLALPRPHEGIIRSATKASGDHKASSAGWALPAGWDQGLQEIEADSGMRLIDRSPAADALADGGGGSRGVGLIDALMANVTDNIDDPPLDFYVGVRVPASATLYVVHDTAAAAEDVELVIHMQLPPTFPLSSERCRMLTPIFHPLVEPLWDDDGVRPDGGRMARLPPPPRLRGTEPHVRRTFLQAFREALVDPVACAARIVSSCGNRSHRAADADARVRRWAANATKGVMEAKARGLASEARRIRWRPELHGLFSRAFRVEVRTLLLALQRFEDAEEAQATLLPREVVWIIIEALFERHRASGSLFFSR